MENVTSTEKCSAWLFRFIFVAVCVKPLYPVASFRNLCSKAGGIITALTISFCVVVSALAFFRYSSKSSSGVIITTENSVFPLPIAFLKRIFLFTKPLAIAIAFPFCQSVPLNAKSRFWSVGVKSSNNCVFEARRDIACKSSTVFKTRRSSGNSLSA